MKNRYDELVEYRTKYRRIADWEDGDDPVVAERLHTLHAAMEYILIEVIEALKKMCTRMISATTDTEEIERISQYSAGLDKLLPHVGTVKPETLTVSYIGFYNMHEKLRKHYEELHR